MRFRTYDNLRLFDVVARHLSFTAAAHEINLTKGAVSYQIQRLENELGFKVFIRKHRGIALTEKGKKLWHSSQAAFLNLEQEITRLREQDLERINIGMSTYFASRWLSPLLMNFMDRHPKIGLSLQPVIGLIDFRKGNIDMGIRWGKGDWTDMETELLFLCSAKPTAGVAIAKRIDDEGIEAVLPDLLLLHDRDDFEAWVDWHKAAGLVCQSTQNGLVIPDPNVRVQSVINGQGVALNDLLVAPELSAGQLREISTVGLSDYGYYLVYPSGSLDNPSLKAFRDWIMDEACSYKIACECL